VSGYLQTYQAFANRLLVSLDGVHYFASTAIHCPQCNVTLRDDQAYYGHAALLPVLVAQIRRLFAYSAMLWYMEHVDLFNPTSHVIFHF
jgi:hypothetical protein